MTEIDAVQVQAEDENRHESIETSRSSDSGERNTSGTISKSRKIIEATKKGDETVRYSDNPEVQDIVNFLRGKDASENLIGRVLKNDLWECGFFLLLRGIGITNDEIKKFCWKRRLDSCDFTYHSPEIASTTFDDESSISPHNLYLKSHFADILVPAIKDILKLKPNDPIDFLANWLVNYEVCKEREHRRKEFEAQLDARREFSKDLETISESEITGYGGQENWSYGEHEDM